MKDLIITNWLKSAIKIIGKAVISHYKITTAWYQNEWYKKI